MNKKLLSFLSCIPLLFSTVSCTSKEEKEKIQNAYDNCLLALRRGVSTTDMTVYNVEAYSKDNEVKNTNDDNTHIEKLYYMRFDYKYLTVKDTDQTSSSYYYYNEYTDTYSSTTATTFAEIVELNNKVEIETPKLKLNKRTIKKEMNKYLEENVEDIYINKIECYYALTKAIVYETDKDGTRSALYDSYGRTIYQDSIRYYYYVNYNSESYSGQKDGYYYIYYDTYDEQYEVVTSTKDSFKLVKELGNKL